MDKKNLTFKFCILHTLKTLRFLLHFQELKFIKQFRLARMTFN